MQTTQDPEDFYEVLGVRPGATLEEIKAAYRDMAKVWHPDRFAHDPKLEQKAQEKLKEINEAYKQLSTALVQRPRASRTSSGRAAAGASPGHSAGGASRARAPHRGAAYAQPPARARRQSGHARKLSKAILALAVLGVLLMVAFPVLKSKSGETPLRTETAPATQPDAGYEAAAGQPSLGARKAKRPVGRRDAGEDSGPAASEPASTAVPTVNVTVDPTTGLLATTACPNKMLVTYVRGEEPRRRCDAEHRAKETARHTAAPAAAAAEPPAEAAPAPAEQAPAAEQPQKPQSKVKSILKTVVSPGKWFRRKKQG